MKYLIYLTVVIPFLFSCNRLKEYPNSIVLGETKDMNVIEYDKTFKGIWVGTGELNRREHSFDLDGDEIFDFSLCSFTDTILSSLDGTSEIIYGAYLTLGDSYGNQTQYSGNDYFMSYTNRDTLLPGESMYTSYRYNKYSCAFGGLNTQEIDAPYCKRMKETKSVAVYSEDWVNYGADRIMIYQLTIKHLNMMYLMNMIIPV